MKELHEATSTAVLNAVLDIFTILSPPRYLRTDGGGEMKRFHEIAAYGVIHITGLRWSEGQGSAERRVKEVKTLLTRIVSSSHLDPASSKILLPQPNGQ